MVPPPLAECLQPDNERKRWDHDFVISFLRCKNKSNGIQYDMIFKHPDTSFDIDFIDN